MRSMRWSTSAMLLSQHPVARIADSFSSASPQVLLSLLRIRPRSRFSDHRVPLLRIAKLAWPPGWQSPNLSCPSSQAVKVGPSAFGFGGTPLTAKRFQTGPGPGAPANPNKRCWAPWKLKVLRYQDTILLVRQPLNTAQHNSQLWTCERYRRSAHHGSYSTRARVGRAAVTR